MTPDTWTWIEKAGILTVLLMNVGAMFILGRFIFLQLQARQWVPGWVYQDLAHERDYLRVENQALRSVTLKAIRVTENILGAEEAP